MRIELEPDVVGRHAALAVGVRPGLLDRRRVEAVDSDPEGRVRRFSGRTGDGGDHPGTLDIVHRPYPASHGVPAPVVGTHGARAHVANDNRPVPMRGCDANVRRPRRAAAQYNRGQREERPEEPTTQHSPQPDHTTPPLPTVVTPLTPRPS